MLRPLVWHFQDRGNKNTNIIKIFLNHSAIKDHIMLKFNVTFNKKYVICNCGVDRF
jgi:hypothetical protein